MLTISLNSLFGRTSMRVSCFVFEVGDLGLLEGKGKGLLDDGVVVFDHFGGCVVGV